MGTLHGKWGYINQEGQIAIELRFDYADDFSDGLANVLIEKEWGYIDKSGQIKFMLDSKLDGSNEYDFHEGLALASLHLYRPRGGSRTLLGYIDKTGNMIIEARFADAGDFCEGVARVKIANVGDGDREGYIDHTGLLLIERQFTVTSDFSEGLALVLNPDRSERCGYIDKTGEYVVEPRYFWGGKFSQGLAPVQMESATAGRSRNIFPIRPPRGRPKADRWGYIDSSGQVVIDKRFRAAEAFSEGLAAVKMGTDVWGQRGIWGYVNRMGKLVIKPQFEQASSFSEGLAAVKIADKYGYIDKTGQVVIEPRFEAGGPFEEGIARVWLSKVFG
ncbi:MAG: WG repeat-containing protein, partial [Planctomycetota bacterium]